jgi:drug/metabolite transporter (DMT)-like permease
LCVMRLSPNDLIHSPLGNVFPILAGVLLAINGMIIKYGLAGIEGPVVAYLNTMVVSVVMLPILTITASWQELLRLGEGQEIVGLILAGMSYAISLLAYYYVIKKLPVWISRSFTLLSPIVAIIGGRLIFHEVHTLGQFLGALLIMLGISIVLVYRALTARQQSFVTYRRVAARLESHQP